MRSGTRKVADSKPDAPVTRKDSDAIPMSQIGKIVIFLSFNEKVKVFVFFEISFF